MRPDPLLAIVIRMFAFERYSERVQMAFGSGADSIALVAARAEALISDVPVIVWEGDAKTFEFSFVSASAEQILGYPCERWLTEGTFWADVVVHPEDRGEAIAYCALATGKGKDHAFEYRAKAADGRIVTLIDYVQVVFGRRRIAERLRGVMIDVSQVEVAPRNTGRWQRPPRQVLEEAAAGG